MKREEFLKKWGLCPSGNQAVALIDCSDNLAKDLDEIEPKEHPHVCPVCCGRQYAPMGFYDGPMSTSINIEKCRTCNGTGVIWR